MHLNGQFFLRYLRYYYLKFTRLNDNPHALAGGTAIGVMVGLTPTVPFHTAIIILFTLLTKTSMVAALLVSWVVFNPLTMVPIYSISVVIGNLLTPYEVSFSRIRAVLDQSADGATAMELLGHLLALGYETVLVLIVGGLVFSLPFGLISYYCALSYFTRRASKKNGTDDSSPM